MCIYVYIYLYIYIYINIYVYIYIYIHYTFYISITKPTLDFLLSAGLAKTSPDGTGSPSADALDHQAQGLVAEELVGGGATLLTNVYISNK